MFLKSPENFLGLKSQLSNCNLLILKSWSFNMFLVRKKKNQEDCKVDALEPLRCEAIEGMVAPEKFQDF